MFLLLFCLFSFIMKNKKEKQKIIDLDRSLTHSLIVKIGYVWLIVRRWALSGMGGAKTRVGCRRETMNEF